MLNEKRFYTFACVAERYRHECGESGVMAFFQDSVAKVAAANGLYAVKLDSWEPLSSREVKKIGLTRHPQATWYRLNASAVEGHMVGAGMVS